MTEMDGKDMARPTRCRKICAEPAYDSYRPMGIPTGEKITMTVDEYETLRLIDLEKCTHEQCAKQMGISRTTVTELYESARYKLADSVINGKILNISGGNYRLCNGRGEACCHRNCKRTDISVKTINKKRKEAGQMRIGVTYENGNIFQHFGHTEQFKLYDVENGEIRQTQVVTANGQGHGALASFLTQAGVDILICGGIGGGAQMALAQAGIKLYGGVSGEADEAVKQLLSGNLAFNPVASCTHHEHGHSCGEHHCGEDKQGCAGNESSH